MNGKRLSALVLAFVLSVSTFVMTNYAYTNNTIIHAATVKLQPKTTLDSPGNKANISNSFTITGWSLNQSGVKEVDILIDGVKKGTANLGASRIDVYNAYKSYNNKNSGYSYLVAFTSISGGNHTITVKAIGNDNTSSTASAIINKLNSLFSVDSPGNISITSKSVNVAGWSLSPVGVKEVDVLLDGVQKGIATLSVARTDVYNIYKMYNNKDSGFNYNLDLSAADYGKHTITVKTVGNDGTNTSIVRTINYNKLASMVDIDTKNNQTVTGDFNLTGWSLDMSGISKVEIYQGLTLLGTANINVARLDVAKAYPIYNLPDSGYSCPISFSRLKSGNNILTVASTGNDGSVTYNSITVNLLGAMLDVDTPANNVTLDTPSIVVAGWALNARGINKVEISVDNVLKGTATLDKTILDVYNAYKSYSNTTSGYTYTLDTSALTNAVNSITVKSTGNDGVITYVTRTFNLALPPTILPTAITLNKTTDSLVVGGTDDLVADINPVDTTNKNAIWTSSDNVIATVDNTGKITAIGVGTAIIMATTANGEKVATCTVTINSSNAIDSTKYNLDITGVKDASPGFQKMADSLPIGSTIYLSKGIYKFDNTVTMKDGITIVASKDVVIIGDGTNTLFNAGNFDTFNGINFEQCSTAIEVFEKKTVDVLNSSFGNNITYAAINYYGSSASLVESCSFSDIRKYGVLIDDDSADITIDSNNFNNSTIYGGYTTPQIGGHVYCLNGTRITVSNNVLSNSGGQGVIFCYNSTTGKGTTDSVAINNLCQGNGQEGATIYGGNNKVTSGNSIINNNCTNNRFNQIEVWQADNCIIKDNIVSETVPGIGNLGAICLFATTGTTCIGNKVLSSQSNGIDITAGSSNCIVSDNNIADTNRKNDINTPEQGNGILLDSNAVIQPQYITITNNTISASNGIINKSGIYSTSNTNHYNTISGNIITGYKYGVNPYAVMTCET